VSISFASRPRLVVCVLFAGLLTVALLSIGCAGGNPYPAGSYERGVFFADQGKDIEAVGAFESFVRHSPTDSLAADAQYRKALSYMKMKEYPLAAVEFQILRKDYPTSSLVGDALFEEGKAYLFQVGRVERDLTGAYEARLHFLNFSQQYPASEHMDEVVGYMQEISDLMVRKRLGQIKVYDQLKRYKSIAVVLDDVMKEESGSSLIPEVMWRRGVVAERLDDPDTAADMYEKLIQQFPDSEFRDQAARRLAKLNETDEPDSDS